MKMDKDTTYQCSIHLSCIFPSKPTFLSLMPNITSPSTSLSMISWNISYSLGSLSLIFSRRLTLTWPRSTPTAWLTSSRKFSSLITFISSCSTSCSQQLKPSCRFSPSRIKFRSGIKCRKKEDFLSNHSIRISYVLSSCVCIYTISRLVSCIFFSTCLI